MNITAADTAWLISRCQEHGMRIERPTYDPNAPGVEAIKSRIKRAAARQLNRPSPKGQTNSSVDAGSLDADYREGRLLSPPPLIPYRPPNGVLTAPPLDDWRAGKRVAKKGTQKYVTFLRDRPELKTT